MRILFWTNSFWPRIGGIETQSLQYLEAMSQRGHQFRVIATKLEDLAQDDFYMDIPIKRFPFNQALGKFDPKQLGLIHHSIDALLQEFKPDVLHINVSFGWSDFFFLLFQSLFSIPVILTLHNSPQKGIPFPEKLFNAADQICCVSKELSREIKAPSKVIYCGLAMPEIRPAPPPSSPTLLLLGRLSPEKGFDTAIKAFSLLKKKWGAKLMIGGIGEEMPRLKELAGSLNVEFRGKIERDQIPHLINEATLLIAPSHVEAFGLSALEAMQMGRPVIASNVGGLPEVVLDGKTGLLVPPKDAEALLLAIEDLLNHPEKRTAMGALGRERAKQFSLRRLVEAYEEVYK
jgi:glycogen(starch) synthase